MTATLSVVGSVSASRSVRSGRFYCIHDYVNTAILIHILGCGGSGPWSTSVTGEAPEAVEEDKINNAIYYI